MPSEPQLAYFRTGNQLLDDRVETQGEEGGSQRVTPLNSGGAGYHVLIGVDATSAIQCPSCDVWAVLFHALHPSASGNRIHAS